jgi:hypothetical protein
VSIKKMKESKMPTNIRLTKKEQENLRNRCVEINKILVKKGLEPLRDSELAHKIFPQAIEFARVSETGEVYVEQ